MHGRVNTVEWPTPHLARIVLDGDGLEGFTPTGDTDSYVNVAIPPAGAPYSTPFALEDLKALPNEVRPYRRRYTVRRWDAERRELTIEVVVHGDGPGGGWARDAQPGDALVFTGPAGGYRPDPEADWHLLVGDESALPAIGASLEAVPAGAPVVVRLVCDGPEHELALETPGELDLVWLHRTGGAGDEDLLPEAVRALDAPPGVVHGFIHGEAGETREVRRHLLAERGIDPARLSCSPYWRRGLDDEAWRKVKAAWNADVARDVPVG
ncbi:siderophore-interacting protein [Conexibacter sp. SYSU D00693]|uniref:siderophore-interacting protein n=1 Tax=Conexibacter sp. SYSU D00693 TaxID=2812560 RepID=UPI00196A9F82|nr:siderophore-interacting protein [Conexibacter sp. SYSU D00693]